MEEIEERVSSVSGKEHSIVGDLRKKKEEVEPKEVEPKTFYITPEQSKQLAMEKAIEGKDLSTIVRQAIDYYFANKEEVKKYFNEK